VVPQLDYLWDGQEGFHPLVATPSMVLEFAELVENGITKDVWLDWVRRYGVLGFEGNGEVADRWWASPRGGPRETLTAFVEEASQANAVLRIYEAATSPGGPDVAVLSDFASKTEPALSAIEGWTEFKVAETASALQASGLKVAWKAVASMLAGHCYPELYASKDAFGSREAFAVGWGFKSLLGAIYLQMAWLMTTVEDVRHCQGPKCNKIIAYEQPEKGAHPQLRGRKNDRSAGYRKTRKDKRFCGSSCKSLWHYYYGEGDSTRNAHKSHDAR
jgi:hypothetical protein